jgi:hypothetical protein
MNRESRSGGLDVLRTLVALLACVAAVVAAIGLFRLSDEAGTRSCIAKAQAKFPAVPVTAFLTRNRTAVGPLKVSYDAERRRAVDKCA